MIEDKSNRILLLFCALVLLGLAVDAVPYDYSFTLECLSTPHKPQYSGGIVVNPELDHELNGWTSFGGAKIEQRVSKEGNSFIVAHHRYQPHHSFSQKFYLEKGKLYTFSAWLQVSEGNAKIAATFKTPSSIKRAGWVDAQSGCWSMLKGGLVVNASAFAELYFESNNSKVEIWADSISLQPFTEEEWTSHQNESIEKVRKRSLKLQVVDAKGNPLPNTKVSVAQKAANFPFGCAMSKYILSNQGYQSWFTSRFKFTTFENEMKWDSTEPTRGQEDYSVPDSMLQFTKTNQISVRGHNVVWDDPQHQPQWLSSLPPDEFQKAVDTRINSLVKRYAGQVIAWDVVNENLHFNFFESRLGPNATVVIFEKVSTLDPKTTLFLNEFNTIEEKQDAAASPDKYLQKIQELRKGGYAGPLGIGLQGHFTTPDLAYMRSAIDKLAAAKSPIWLTEVDVQAGPNQATYLEQVLREGHGNPNVNGIVMWAAWRPEGCNRMCLTDNNFKNLATGDVVDKLIKEWQGGFSGTTDSNGYLETSLFHGDYEVSLTHPNATSTSTSGAQFFKVGPINTASQQQSPLFVKVFA